MRFRIWVSAALAGVILVVLSGPAQAHHSIPSFYDENKTISITGLVTQVKIINPHSQIFLEVTDPNGQKATWIAITVAGTQMIRNRWAADVFKVGSTLTLAGNPPRKQGTNGIVLHAVTTSDGKTFKLGID